MRNDLSFQPVRTLAGMLAEKRIGARELADHFLGRIADCNELSKAYVTVTENVARAAADRFDRGDAPAHPLSGIPIAYKDLIDIAGVRTTGGSRVLYDNIAEEDAFLVARMRDAGAVSLGKTNLHEFAYGATGENTEYGTCINAYDPTRLAGGSSSGSAAAVAFGLAPAAFGTDTGGSVRAPATLNGLVGLKPTIGRVSTRGVIPYCWTLDHVGIITRTVADCADLLTTVAGCDPKDPAATNEPTEDYALQLDGGIAGLRIGLPERFYFEYLDPEILEATHRVRRMLEAAGATVVPVDLPNLDYARTVSLTVQMPEALSYHARYLEEREALYSEDFKAGLALGQCLLAEHYVRAKRFIENYRQQTNRLFADVDLLLTPATPSIAPKLGSVKVTTDGLEEAVGNAITRYTTFFNMTGHPAITVPSGLHTSGLPMGVQLVGRYFEEGLLLKVADRIQADDSFQVPPPQV